MTLGLEDLGLWGGGTKACHLLIPQLLYLFTQLYQAFSFRSNLRKLSQNK
jgi:hypothetical protein